MSDKYQNKYSISSTRLKNWDYGSNGAYFITICTKKRECYFGEIINNVPEPSTNERTMQLSEIGKLAEQFWLEIPNHFSFIELGNFVVMPNHVHGILIIDKPYDGSDGSTVEALQCNASTTVVTANAKNEKMANISPKQGSISTIIRSYKSVVSKNAHFIHTDFSWQSRFHDHIIRNSGEFERIQNYIANNILNWKDDKFYS